MTETRLTAVPGRAEEEPALDGPGGGLPAGALDRAVDALRGLAYGSRLQIMTLLRDGEKTPTALAEAIGAHQSAVAHHLRNLVDAGLLRRRRQGRYLFYSLTDDSTARLIDAVMRYAGER
ncbi:ArsR/SmtB family transcription factor [Paractinoplanes lichenicola]|uniref:Transcriptional regulator n=1 Tax=Paractinoplanes lichenicola TaxID=2802976 RepID=A0ABS1VGY0_9ACTN|nr:metalloregulator ArsR/SmtB family transcription factor [Actinoplanes lichenicola]MBL7252691.1 transcriptional regulator [Actinoplanes lichenicola]